MNKISIDILRQIIFSVLGYDDFNLVRSNKVYDRILFDYGYYSEGVTSKRIKGCLFYYNHICNLGNSFTEYYGEYKFIEGKNYQYKLSNQEINKIIKLLKEHE